MRLTPNPYLWRITLLCLIWFSLGASIVILYFDLVEIVPLLEQPRDRMECFKGENLINNRK